MSTTTIETRGRRRTKETVRDELRVRHVASRGGKDYRSASHAVEIERAERAVELPSDVRFVVLGAGILFGLLGALGLATRVSALPGPTRMLVVVAAAALGIAAWVHGADRARHAARDRAVREERTDRAVSLRIDDDAVRAAPRDDEDWDGVIALDRIARVYASDGAEGMRRVRVRLDDGTSRTLVDGLDDAREAEVVLRHVRAALERASAA